MNSSDLQLVIGIVLIVSVLILFIFISEKIKTKKALKLLENYKNGGENYLARMQKDLSVLNQEMSQIEPLVKEYNTKRNYITKQYDSQSAAVRREYSRLEQQANKAGSVHMMGQYRSQGNNETLAITQQRNNELEMLKSQYSNILSGHKKLQKEIDIFKRAIKLSK
jgi:hypothetical protein